MLHNVLVEGTSSFLNKSTCVWRRKYCQLLEKYYLTFSVVLSEEKEVKQTTKDELSWQDWIDYTTDGLIAR